MNKILIYLLILLFFISLSNIVFGSQSAQNNINSEHTVTATVQDTKGNPIKATNVFFEILSGPNAGKNQTVATNAQGKASFTYIGNSVGTDVIQASFYSNAQELIKSNQVTKEWITSTEQKPTIVNGHVYASDGHTPVSGANVKITCDSAVKETTTNSEGYYVVEYFDVCNEGSTVTIESNGFTAEGKVKSSRVITKNIAYINLSVPEFGTIAALIALIGSVAVFAVIRKRN